MERFAGWTTMIKNYTRSTLKKVSKNRFLFSSKFLQFFWNGFIPLLMAQVFIMQNKIPMYAYLHIYIYMIFYKQHNIWSSISCIFLSLYNLINVTYFFLDSEQISDESLSFSVNIFLIRRFIPFDTCVLIL